MLGSTGASLSEEGDRGVTSLSSGAGTLVTWTGAGGGGAGWRLNMLGSPASSLGLLHPGPSHSTVSGISLLPGPHSLSHRPSQI